MLFMSYFLFKALDTSDLNIKSVHNQATKEKLSFKLGEKHKAFGTPLYIDLPGGLKRYDEVSSILNIL